MEVKVLSEEQKFNNKQHFLKLAGEAGIDLAKLLPYLDSARVDYFNKPYAIYPAAAYSGSLCQHALKFYAELLKLSQIYFPNKYSNADIIKVALLSGLYRAELFESYFKNVKNEDTGKWEAVVGYRNKEERPAFGDIGFASYMIAKKFIDLNDDEIVEAICFGNIGAQTNIDSFNIKLQYNLVTLALMAEQATLYIDK